MPRGLNKQSVARKLFERIVADLDDSHVVFSNPQAVFRLGGVEAYLEQQRWNELQEKQLETRKKKRAVAELQRQRFIETRNEGEKLLVRLTEKGVQQSLRQTVIEKRAFLPKGEYCYVSFDLPESVRALRDAFRLILKEAKFRMVHQSLWYASRDIGAELASLVELMDATKYIHIYQGRRLTVVHKKHP